MPDPVLFNYTLNGQGGIASEDSAEQSRQATCWIHLDAKHPQAIETFKKLAPEADEDTVDALFDSSARPRTLVFNDSVLLILRGINFDGDSKPEDMVGIRIWANSNLVISIRFRAIQTIQEIQQQLFKGKGVKSTGQLVEEIADRLFEKMEPFLDSLAENVDSLEEQVIESPNIELRKKIAETRKKTIFFRRYVSPQREAMNQLRASELSWLDKKNQRSILENVNTIVQYLEDLDVLRERCQVVKDELVNTLSDRLNRNLYVISVITAIFLPLGFLTGLFGINIGGMPGVDQPNAFLIFTIILLIIVAIQIILFKLFKWF